MSSEEKYGVPVAARVRPEVAEHLKMMALKRNKSLAKCLAEVIETAPLLGGEEYAGTIRKIRCEDREGAQWPLNTVSRARCNPSVRNHVSCHHEEVPMD